MPLRSISSSPWNVFERKIASFVYVWRWNLIEIISFLVFLDVFKFICDHGLYLRCAVNRIESQSQSIISRFNNIVQFFFTKASVFYPQAKTFTHCLNFITGIIIHQLITCLQLKLIKWTVGFCGNSKMQTKDKWI